MPSLLRFYSISLADDEYNVYFLVENNQYIIWHARTKTSLILKVTTLPYVKYFILLRLNGIGTELGRLSPLTHRNSPKITY
jgi:hypothetical protein